jgi:hypothetical protein
MHTSTLLFYQSSKEKKRQLGHGANCLGIEATEPSNVPPNHIPFLFFSTRGERERGIRVRDKQGRRSGGKGREGKRGGGTFARPFFLFSIIAIFPVISLVNILR